MAAIDESNFLEVVTDEGDFQDTIVETVDATVEPMVPAEYETEEGTGFQDAGIEAVEVPTSNEPGSIEEVIALEGGEAYSPTIGHMESYFNTLTPGGIQYNNPTLGYNVHQDDRGGIDAEAPDFKEVFDATDIDTKRAMLEATSNTHALTIAKKRKVFEESLKVVQEDPLAMQFVYGAIPAMTDWTTVVSGPLGLAAGSAWKVSSGVSKINRIGRGLGAGATVGGIVNLASEYAFEQEGLQSDLLSATLFGMGFGGTLGTISGGLSGPNSEAIAKAFSAESDSFTKDYHKDPDLVVNYEDGTIKIAKMEKSMIDRIPYIGKWLRSDVHTALQSDSQLIRSEMDSLAHATVSSLDTNGEVIVYKFNATDSKQEAGGVHGALILEIKEVVAEARQNGFKGTSEELVAQISDAYVQAAQKQEIDAYKYAQVETTKVMDTLGDPGKIESTFNKKLDEYYVDNPVDFSKLDIDKSIARGAKGYQDYYNTMRDRGAKLGVEGLKKVSTGKLYRPRVWDFREIQTGMKKGRYTDAQLHTTVKESLRAHPAQADLVDSQLDLVTQEITSMLKSGTFDLNYMSSSFNVPKELPFDQMLKQRKYKLDESKLGKLIKTDLNDVTAAYQFKMSGRQALAFVYKTDDIEAISQMRKDKLMDEGIATAEEIKALDRIIQDIAGNLRMNALSNTPAWEFTRNMATYNSSRMGGGFGGNQFIELMSNIMLSSVTAMINSGRFTNSFKNAGKLLYTEGKVADEFTRSLVRAGHLSDVLHTNRVNRYSDSEQGFNSGWLENNLHHINDKLMKYNGMRYFMGVMEDMTGGAIVEQITTLSKQKGFTQTEIKRMARWGLKPSDLRSIAKDIDLHTNLKEGKFDLEAFTEVNRDKLQLAISRGINEAVIQGDSLHLANWMKAPGPYTKLITQFMRFPMIANEVLLRKGMTEEQARMGSAVVASTMTYMGLKHVREQASIQLGLIHETDAKYDYFGTMGEEHMMRAFQESINYNAPLGMMGSLWDLGMNMSGEAQLGRDYGSRDQMAAFMGVTFGGTIPDLLSLFRDAYQGDFDERSANKIKSLVPINNLPIIHEAFKALNEEMF